MGLNTWAAFTGSDADAMVAGDVVNSAARLQQNAPVGEIVVGEETYRATRAAIAYEPTKPTAWTQPPSADAAAAKPSIAGLGLSATGAEMQEFLDALNPAGVLKW